MVKEWAVYFSKKFVSQLAKVKKNGVDMSRQCLNLSYPEQLIPREIKFVILIDICYFDRNL